MQADRQLFKYRGLQWVSQTGSGSIVLEDAESFIALGSVQEALGLSVQVGGTGAIVFQEQMLVLKGRRARPVTVYFLVRSGQLEYVGCCSEGGKWRTPRRCKAEAAGVDGGAGNSLGWSWVLGGAAWFCR